MRDAVYFYYVTDRNEDKFLFIFLLPFYSIFHFVLEKQTEENEQQQVMPPQGV
jgi:hypothetical protein